MGVPAYLADHEAEARAPHVFLSGNGLPGRWQGRSRFVILATRFGAGNRFLSTWAAWLADPKRCDQLVFVCVEKQPLRAADLAKAHGLADAPTAQTSGPAPSPAPHAELAHRLHAAWPPQTVGLHMLDFDHAELTSTQGVRPSVRLILAHGDVAKVLPSLMLQADAFYLDGLVPSSKPKTWNEGLLSRLNRLAAPGATLTSWACAQSAQDALAQAGFKLHPLPDLANKPDMLTGHFEPRHVPAPLPGGLWPEAALSNRHAIVVGAGLAGCSAARALCRQGWHVTLIDARAGPAQEASGNPGGLFHSVLHGDDGIHARAHRAAALATWALAAPWVHQGLLPGQCEGLLRLDDATSSEQAHALLDAQNLQADHVRWLTQAQAQACSGIHVPCGAWLFAQAGWLQPFTLARLMLDDAAQQRSNDGQPLLQTRFGQATHRLARAGNGDWQALNAQGELLAQAPTLVLANAQAAQGLLDTLPADQQLAPLPLSRVRGQISSWPSTSAQFDQVKRPAMPVAGNGYVLSLPDGGLLCGATSQPDDLDPSVRAADHRHNIELARQLGAVTTPPCDTANAKAECAPADLPDGLLGRTGWRAATPDRLPLVGALPWSTQRLAAHPKRLRLDQARLIPRERSAQGGLYCITGLGSRGITWAPLAAELLAHWVTGSPCPLETELRDALDPARFVARHHRTLHNTPPTHEP